MKLVEATFGLIFKVGKITEREVRKEIFRNKFWNIFTCYLYGLLVPAQDLRIAASWLNHRIHRIFSVPFSILLQILRNMSSFPPGNSLCVIIFENEVLGSVRGTLLASRSHELEFVICTYLPRPPCQPLRDLPKQQPRSEPQQPFCMFTLNTRGFWGRH